MLEQVVRDALSAEPRGPQDAAVAELALTYAREVDGGDGDLAKLGPALLTALEALHMSPRARAAAKKAVTTGDKPKSRLDELRERRSRKSRATALDAAAP